MFPISHTEWIRRRFKQIFYAHFLHFRASLPRVYQENAFDTVVDNFFSLHSCNEGVWQTQWATETYQAPESSRDVLTSMGSKFKGKSHRQLSYFTKCPLGCNTAFKLVNQHPGSWQLLYFCEHPLLWVEKPHLRSTSKWLNKIGI